MSNRKPRNISEIPHNPATFAAIRRAAALTAQRGAPIPAHVTQWLQQGEAIFNGMAPQQQAQTLREVDYYDQRASQHDAVTDRIVGMQEGERWFKEHSRGIGGEFEGVDAKRLREIAENKTTVTQKRVPARTESGAVKADPWSKQTQYETQRKESRKYSDSDSRRASLVLAFGQAEAERASRGAQTYTDLNDDIDENYVNSPHERTRDVAAAMLECESRAAVGADMPTGEYQRSDPSKNG